MTQATHPHQEILKWVRRIPRGRVATYGQIAQLAGLPQAPRQVGMALRALPAGSAVPWHRVLGARGTISPRGDGDSEEEQRFLLEAEGVLVAADGKIDLQHFRWRPRTRPERPRAENQARAAES